MLHAIDSKGWTETTSWCVPTVISFLTGIPLAHSHSRAAFLQDISLKDVEGVHGSEAVLLLREQGYVCRELKLSERYENAPRLKKFLKERTPYEQCIPLMIQIENTKTFCHMISAHFGYAADNHTMKPVPIEQFPHLNKYVTRAWTVGKKD